MASIAHQVYRCLAELKLSKAEIDQLKSELNVPSLKKALRPNGDPTRPLPCILGDETYVTYFRIGRTFFGRAKELTGEKLIKKMLTYNVIMLTFHTYYASQSDGSISKLQAATKKIYEGALSLGWVNGPCPIENQLRSCRTDHVRKHRDGYPPGDAKQLIDYLYIHSHAYAVPADIAYQCGLREDEVAGLKKSNVDPTDRVLHVTGKGGKRRTVPIPSILLERLVSIHTVTYFFTPSESWCANFRTTVQKACRALEIDGSGVHRLRSTYAQMQYTRYRLDGMDDKRARLEVSHLLGHNRISVTYIYIPRAFDWQEYRCYFEQEAD